MFSGKKYAIQHIVDTTPFWYNMYYVLYLLSIKLLSHFLSSLIKKMEEESCNETDKTREENLSVDDENDNQDTLDLFGEAFIPSISDRLQIGFASMDRACQTEVSEIVDLKRMTEVLSFVVKDLAALKKGLYFSKLTLQAEYDGRLEQVVLELYNRVHERIAEIESIHKERVEVIRRSYKQQMSNALTKLSRDYHVFYGSKDALAEAENKKKVEEMRRHQDLLRKNELAQKEMYEMLRMQMEESKAKEVEEIPSRKSSAVSISGFVQEIEELKKSLKNYESRVDYLEECLEETSYENQKLTSELDEQREKLTSEQHKTSALNKDVSDLKTKLERDRNNFEQELVSQRDNLRKEMYEKIEMLRKAHQDEINQRLDEARQGQYEKIRQQKMAEEARIKALMAKQEQEKTVVVEEVSQDTDVSRLALIERKQRAEISRLHKRVEQLNKLSEMKIKVLNEHIHALKNEMFMRTTLQRQTAKVKQATVTYVRRGSDVLPAGLQPMENSKVPRRHRLPSLIGGPTSAGDETAN